jgi:hypothetical protein
LIYGINIDNQKGQLEMGDLIELPEGAGWNPTTGTFDKLGSKTAEADPQQFADLIQERFGASELTPDQKAKALTMLDNGVVYLHGVDPTNRLDRSPAINSIAAEWATLGITMKQAEFMIDSTIDHTGRQHQIEFGQETDQFAELAVGDFSADGGWVDERQDHEDFWAHDDAKLAGIEQADRGAGLEL